MSSIKEMRDLKEEELLVMLKDLNKEIFQLKNQLMTMKQIEKPHLIKDKKKDRARILMVLHEKRRKNG